MPRLSRVHVAIVAVVTSTAIVLLSAILLPSVDNYLFFLALVPCVIGIALGLYWLISGVVTGQLLGHIWPQTSVGGQWSFVARDNQGRIFLYGTFLARETLVESIIANGMCWDVRIQDIETLGVMNGRFMRTPRANEIRLVWWMARLQNQNRPNSVSDNHEPYSGVATLTRRDSKGRPIRFEGGFKEGSAPDPVGYIRFLRGGYSFTGTATSS